MFSQSRCRSLASIHKLVGCCMQHFISLPSMMQKQADVINFHRNAVGVFFANHRHTVPTMVRFSPLLPRFMNESFVKHFSNLRRPRDGS